MISIKTVLIIDDEDCNHFIYKRMLGLFASNLIVHNSYNGLQGLDVVRKHRHRSIDKIDLILLDLNMPVMNGFQFIEALKNIVIMEEEEMIIAMITSSIDSKDLEKARRLGIVNYFNKPISESIIRTLLKIESPTHDLPVL